LHLNLNLAIAKFLATAGAIAIYCDMLAMQPQGSPSENGTSSQGLQRRIAFKRSALTDKTATAEVDRLLLELERNLEGAKTSLKRTVTHG